MEFNIWYGLRAGWILSFFILQLLPACVSLFILLNVKTGHTYSEMGDRVEWNHSSSGSTVVAKAFRTEPERDMCSWGLFSILVSRKTFGLSLAQLMLIWKQDCFLVFITHALCASPSTLHEHFKRQTDQWVLPQWGRDGLLKYNNKGYSLDLLYMKDRTQRGPLLWFGAT